MKDSLAWGIAIVSVAAEVFIATLDVWFDIPHLVLNVTNGFTFEWKE
jgi:hypothetical protein